MSHFLAIVIDDLVLMSVTIEALSNKYSVITLFGEIHCSKIIIEANESIGLPHHALYPCSKEMKSRTYQTLVRPQPEYFSEACSHYNIATADRLEHMHRATAHFVHYDNQRTTSVNNLINILGWDHLYTRRRISLLTMFHKIHCCLLDVHIPQPISPSILFANMTIS